MKQVDRIHLNLQRKYLRAFCSGTKCAYAKVREQKGIFNWSLITMQVEKVECTLNSFATLTQVTNKPCVNE